MRNVANYQHLEVWKLSMALTTHIFKYTKTFPGGYTNELAKQMQKSAISIPSNIAEGNGRHGKRSFKQFVSIAHVSACELETLMLILCKRN